MTDPLLLETAGRVFAATCGHEAIRTAEREGWAAAAWDRAAEVGLPWLGLPEAAGGAGGTLADALAVLRIAGAHAAPIPLAETGLLAGWLLAGAGLPVVAEAATAVPGRPEDTLTLVDGRLRGTAHRVPWARAVPAIVALVDAGPDSVHVAAVPAAAVEVEPHVNLAGEPRDTVTFPAVVPAALAPAGPGLTPEALRYRGALTRVMLMAGALERMSALTVAYASERVQFGRPIARFQAVQQHLVVAAQEAALVGIAAAVAAREADRGPARFEIAAAKLLANRAALTATRAAHQAHGAIGMTREYPLHHLSRRLWAWRSEHGDDRFWSARLGAAMVAAGPDRLYPSITGGSRALEL